MRKQCVPDALPFFARAGDEANSEQCLMVKGRCFFFNDNKFDASAQVNRNSYMSGCSLIHPTESSGKDKLHQNTITVMGVTQLSLKQNAHYGPQMKMTFVEFYPVHICYEGLEQHSVAEYSPIRSQIWCN